jgi:hypothetical protein
MEELCTVTVLLQVAALVMGTNSNNFTKMTEQPQPPFKCFHETSAACSGSGCKYLDAKNHTAFCCKLNNFTLKEEITGTVSFSLGFLTSSSQATEFRKPTDENSTPTNFDSQIWMSTGLHTLLGVPGWLIRSSDSPRPRQSEHRILVEGRDFAHLSIPADLNDLMSPGTRKRTEFNM